MTVLPPDCLSWLVSSQILPAPSPQPPPSAQVYDMSAKIHEISFECHSSNLLPLILTFSLLAKAGRDENFTRHCFAHLTCQSSFKLRNGFNCLASPTPLTSCLQNPTTGSVCSSSHEITGPKGASISAGACSEGQCVCAP
eukprot:516257-Hanusia_phi.AAC.1